LDQLLSAELSLSSFQLSLLHSIKSETGA
jgi:hypothetical protein